MVDMLERAETNNPQFQTFNQYQDWVAENWVHPVGTEDSQVHVRKKLHEEVRELSEAIRNGNDEDVLSELGDVLWTSIAVAINEGFTTEEEVKLDAIEETAKSGEIDWNVPALRGLYGLDNHHITELINSGDTGTISNVICNLASRLAKSGSVSRHQASNLDFSDGKHNTFPSAWLGLHHQRLVTTQAQILLLVSLVAQSKLGKNLSDVIQANYEKLNTRLNEGKPVTKLPKD